MAEERTRSLEEMLDDDDFITAAIQRGIREELISGARLGYSAPVSENGKIVWLTPAQIFEQFGVDPLAPAENAHE